MENQLAALKIDEPAGEGARDGSSRPKSGKKLGELRHGRATEMEPIVGSLTVEACPRLPRHENDVPAPQEHRQRRIFPGPPAQEEDGLAAEAKPGKKK